MKISLLNSHDNVGGAAKAAFRLFQGLRQLGYEADLLVRESELNDPDTIVIRRSDEDVYLEKSIQKNCINQNRTDVSNTFFSFNYGDISEQLIEQCKKSNIINLQWIDNFISNKDLLAIVKLKKPIVWTLHDQKPFTGGCHYSAGCEQYVDTCVDCHMLQNDEYKITERVLRQKKDILDQANITVVSPSIWLAEEAKKSLLFANAKVEVIPNAVDIDIFKQLSKQESKQALGINPESIVLQFGAQNGRATRKGFSYLLKAIHLALKDKSFCNRCENEGVVILCLGQPDDEMLELPIKNIILGYVIDEAEMASAYSATDVFILPSLEDNLPNTILESMACGTQVIGFDTGGFSDVVNELNGSVVEKGNCEQLSSAMIDAVLNDEERLRKNTLCRSVIENNYTLNHQANSYQILFQGLIAERVNLGDVQAPNNDSYFDIIGYTLMQDRVVRNVISLEHQLEKSVRNVNEELERKLVFLQEKLDERESLINSIASSFRWRVFDLLQNFRRTIFK